MKRGFIAIAIILLIIPAFAQDVLDKALPKSEEEAREQLKEGTKQIADTAKATINEKITAEVNLPENFKPFARVIFGVKPDEKISLNIFMILIAVWFGFFVIILAASRFIPFFAESAFMRIIFSFIITLLAALTGSLKFTALYIYGLASLFKFLEKFPAIATAIVIVIIIVILIAAKIVASIIEGKLRKEQARIKGEKAGFGAKIAEIFGKMFKE
ncbi:hypothetical protein HYV49_05540 [Candidatus Pacearchaeota archaeon]|nr:hypothetical protein [Candidatus Pacearchaeota archaeon]